MCTAGQFQSNQCKTRNLLKVPEQKRGQIRNWELGVERAKVCQQMTKAEWLLIFSSFWLNSTPDFFLILTSLFPNNLFQKICKLFHFSFELQILDSCQVHNPRMTFSGTLDPAF